MEQCICIYNDSTLFLTIKQLICIRHLIHLLFCYFSCFIFFLCFVPNQHYITQLTLFIVIVIVDPM